MGDLICALTESCTSCTTLPTAVVSFTLDAESLTVTGATTGVDIISDCIVLGIFNEECLLLTAFLELSLCVGCAVWASQVIIPPNIRTSKHSFLIISL